jgi:hypothetical protein
MPESRKSHSSAACISLLNHFMVDIDELRRIMCQDFDADCTDAESDHLIVERLAGALWGVFSNSRAVVDRDGRHFDLGSWRSAAEFIADIANGRYPFIDPPIRYLDCYMAVMLGREREETARPLHRWIFSRLRAAGCDWIYSFDPSMSTVDLRARRREFSAALTQAYEDSADYGMYAPTPGVIGAYFDVYGELPEGWPH